MNFDIDLKSAQYNEFPETGPHLNFDRFDNPKESTKFYARHLKTIIDQGKPLTLADIACANGEMIYHFKKCLPHWQFYGFDYTPKYIELAKTHPALHDVHFECKALNDIKGQFDMVSFFGIITTYWDYRPAFTKLLSLCKPGGYVLVDGIFSPMEVEARTLFMDNSAYPDRWRRDFSVFTQSGVRDFLKDKCSEIRFDDVPMGIELPFNQNAPHINAYTFKDASGRNRLTNGTRVLIDTTLLTIRR